LELLHAGRIPWIILVEKSKILPQFTYFGGRIWWFESDRADGRVSRILLDLPGPGLQGLAAAQQVDEDGGVDKAASTNEVRLGRVEYLTLANNICFCKFEVTTIEHDMKGSLLFFPKSEDLSHSLRNIEGGFDRYNHRGERT